jgi:hypothetical protein
MPTKEGGFLRDDQGREIFSGKPPVSEQGGITVDEDGARAVALQNFTGIGTGGGGGTGTTAPSATTLVEGTVRLAGDLAGTSQAPTVPGLAGKASSTDRRFSRSVIPPWSATTLVDLYERRTAPDGREIQSTAARTTRATYDATEDASWTQIGVDNTDLATGLAAKMDNPTGTKTTGYVPVVQAGGAVAWTAQSGGGTPTAATVSYAGSPSLPTNPATVEDALDVLASGAAVTVSAGTNLATARPTAALVYWKFSAGVDVGWDGVNITNAVSGDLVFVVGRRGPIVVGGAQDRVLSRVAYESLTPDANTRYDILDPLLVQDLFLGRTDTNGWGTAEKGGAYAHTGTLADWSTTTNTGRVILSAANQDKIATLTTVTSTDWDRAALVTLDEVPVGASASIFTLLRIVRANTWFRSWLTINTTGSVTLALSRLIDGVESTLQAATTISGLTFTANKKLWIRARAIGTSPTLLEAKVWEYGTAQPTTWQRSVTNSETDLQAVGGCGLHFRAGTGNTNFPFTGITYMHGDYET